MSQVRFNPKALGTIVTDERGHPHRVVGKSAFIPVVVHGAGVEAIIEGLRLANIEGFNVAATPRDRDVPGEGVVTGPQPSF